MRSSGADFVRFDSALTAAREILEPAAGGPERVMNH